MKKKNKENLRRRIFLLLVILLVLLIILSAVVANRIGRIGLNRTGNIDVFELICTPGDGSGCSLTDEYGNIIENADDAFSVSSNNNTWNSINKLNIFSNPYFEYKSIIAPGSTNAYEFKVNNNSSFDLTYSIEFLEENDYDVNMKYSLKRNGKYILGDGNSWEDLTSGDFSKLELKNNKYDTYVLEWKWVDSDSDTEKGFLNDATYTIKIKIIATAS